VADVRAGFWASVRKNATDRVLLANPLVSGVFCLLRWLHLIAREPYWVYVAIVTVGGLISVLGSSLIEIAAEKTGRTNTQVATQVGLSMAVIGFVAYSTGWGPVLSVGFLFGAAAAFNVFGSRATWSNLICTSVAIALGLTAISLHLAPTLVKAPAVYGVGILGLVGTLLVEELLGHTVSRRESVEAELRQSEQRFKALVSNASDIIVVTDGHGRLQYVSPAFERQLGYTADSYADRPMTERIHSEDFAALQEVFPAILADPTKILRTVLRYQDSAGAWRYFECTISNRLGDPDVRGIVGNLHDITDLRESDERFRSAFENAPIGMAITDPEGSIIRANPAFGRIVGRSPAELLGTPVADLTHPADRESTLSEIRDLVSNGTDGYHIEKRYLHSEGHEVWVSVSVSCVRDAEGLPIYLLGQVEDIHERRALRERLAYAAIHDPLTGLPNRELFMDRLDMALRRAERGGNELTVIFLDLDRFKLINDSLGHDVGDQVLCAVADRLSDAMRSSDTLARFGGDEFTVLCEDVRDESDVLEVAERLIEAMSQPLELQVGEIFVSLSIGIALSRPGESGGTVLRNADIAMYRAKERGPSRVEIYHEDDERNSVSRLRTSNDLHHAIERDELELHYQPFVDLHDESLLGMEALIRWRHPTRGLLMPQEFIPLAEDSGTIVLLGAWVLNEACRQVTRWHESRVISDLDNSRMNISVNVSAVQLADPGFPRQVAKAIENSGIDPDRLWLEITESTLMRDPDQVVEVLSRFRDLGIHIEIDDFGTGYSSLSYLQRFPVESLKIDRSFISELDERSESTAIVRAIIGLGDSLGMPVIAEGVETRPQVAILKDLGCHIAQGFLFGRPMPASALGVFPADDLSSWRKVFEPASAAS
jgi:diguanylate cyclase (GGDEF)-like protein/PAS domain S-box-containing protein